MSKVTHSVPFGRPVPSAIDRRTWQSVAAKLKAPCLFVIVSPAGWRVFRVRSSRRPADIVPLVESEHGSTGLVFRQATG